MSGTWNAHLSMVNGLLDAERARRQAAMTAAQQARATVAPAVGVAAEMPQGVPETWQGGANTGDIGAATAPGDLGSLAGGFGLNAQSVGGLLGALGGGLAGGPLGGLLGGLAGRGIGGLMGPGGAGMNMGDIANDPKDMPMNGGFGLGDGLGLGGMDAANQNAEKDGENNNSWQKGGYTGAGHDGVVQPWKPAGTVHEGELVIPAHMVRMMRMRGLLG